MKSVKRPNGVLFLIGGENKTVAAEQQQLISEDILGRFISLTGKADPRILVITSANERGEEAFEQYRAVFEENGVRNVHHLHDESREEVLSEEQEALVQSADAIFFTGGNQLRLTSVYGGTKFLDRLKERYYSEELVVAGSSAGAMALSTPMIYEGDQEAQQITGEIKVTTGFVFLQNACIDTNSVERGRILRMAQVIASNPTTIGLGLAEDTGIVIKNGKDLEVVGSGSVFLIDGKSIKQSNITESGEKVPISIRDLNVNILVRQNEIELQTTPI